MGVIKFFVKFSPDNFQDKEVTLSQKNLSESINWSNITVFPEKYYFLDTIVWLNVSLQFEKTLT